MTSLDSRPRQGQQVIAQRAEDTVILLHLGSGQYFSLNEVGGRVWEMCDGSHSVAQMIEAIQREYEAAAETVRADVLEVLGDLFDERLLLADEAAA